jgi:autotransporter-associated beta strand protein
VPANNNFFNRITITGTNTTVTGSNLGATIEPNEPLHRGYYGGNSVWWRWTSPAAGFVTFDTIGSPFDTILAVYTGSTIAELVEVASDDNSGGTLDYNSLITFPTRSNITYQIAVDGYDGDAWDLRLRVRFTPASYSLIVTTNPPEAGLVEITPLPDQAGKYVPGELITLTATPVLAPFAGWSDGVSSTNNPLVMAMTSNKTVVANFQRVAGVRYWTGSHPQNGNWTVPNNWDEGKPKAGDKLVFPAGALRLNSNTNDFPAGTVFDSIIFNSNGYVLRGNAVGLRSGILSTNTSGLNTVSLNIQLGSNQVFQCPDTAAQLVVNGDVALANRTLTIKATGDVTLSGVISGTGGIVKTNAGTLSLLGNSPNTFSGPTIVSEGTLQLGKTGVAVPGTLTIGDDTGGARVDVVRFTAHSQLANSSPVTVNLSGQLDLSGFSGVIGPLNLDGGNVDTGSGTLGLNGNATINASSAQANITGNLSLQGATRTFNVADGSAPIDLLVSAVISDGGIIKTGGGRLHLSGANTYAGTTTVNDGTLALFNPSGLGSPGQGTVVNLGASLSVNGVTVNGEPVTLAGGTFESAAGINSWAGNIQLNNNCLFTTAENTTLNLSAVISGNGSLTKSAEGTLILSGASANTYSGVTTVNDGTLLLSKTSGNAIPGPLVIGSGPGNSAPDVVQIDAPQQISMISEITVSDPGVLIVNSSDSIAALSGDGRVVLGNPAATLSVGHGNTSTTFSGLISGVGALIKAGTGSFTLSANNTYTGQTQVDDGVLIVNGLQPGSSVLVTSPGLLGGIGRVGDLSGSGSVSPGLSAGVLLTGNLNLLPNATYRVELNGANPGSGYDQLRVNGTVNLAGTLNASLGFSPATNASFTILENDGSDPVTGMFNDLAEGDFVLIGEALFHISYAAGSGLNDVVLTRAVPPPSTISLLSFNGNDGARIEGIGESGLSYVIEFTPTLNEPISWMPVSTNTADANGVWQFTDGNSRSVPMRFYRARSFP